MTGDPSHDEAGGKNCLSESRILLQSSALRRLQIMKVASKARYQFTPTPQLNHNAVAASSLARWRVKGAPVHCPRDIGNTAHARVLTATHGGAIARHSPEPVSKAEPCARVPFDLGDVKPTTRVVASTRVICGGVTPVVK